MRPNTSTSWSRESGEVERSLSWWLGDWWTYGRQYLALPSFQTSRTLPLSFRGYLAWELDMAVLQR